MTARRSYTQEEINKIENKLNDIYASYGKAIYQKDKELIGIKKTQLDFYNSIIKKHNDDMYPL